MWTTKGKNVYTLDFGVPGFIIVVWQMESGLFATSVMHESDPRPGKMEISATKSLAKVAGENMVTYGTWHEYLINPLRPSKIKVKEKKKEQPVVQKKVKERPVETADAGLMSAVDALRAHFGK